MLTRLNGEQFAINPDLLERIEATPDTVLTMLDGTKYVVLEPVAAVIREIRDFRASVIAAARDLEQEPRLTLAPALAMETAATEEAPQAGNSDTISHISSIHTLRRS